MIRYVSGDIARTRADVVVNPCNAAGAAGAGLSLQLRRAYPATYGPYLRACRDGSIAPGRVLFAPTGVERPRLVAHLPTKRHWRDRSRLDDVRSGLASLVAQLADNGVTSIAVPPLGCGLGGLRWADVERLIVSAFAGAEDLEVLVYAPANARRAVASAALRPGARRGL